MAALLACTGDPRISVVTVLGSTPLRTTLTCIPGGIGINALLLDAETIAFV